MLKYPERKPGICPTFISKEGAGKGTLLELMRKMMGEKKIFETSEPSRDVWGPFNSAMVNSYLVNLNELSRTETSHSEGKIKALITDSAMTINTKGVNQYQIKSYHRFMVTTNNEDPFVTKKDDRRNIIIRSSDEKLGHVKYFNKIHRYMEDQDVIKTCYEHFINIDDLDKFHTFKVPTTEYQKDMQQTAVCPIERWLYDYVVENQDKTQTHLRANEAFETFNEWITLNKIQYQINSTQFGIRMNRFKFDGLTTKRTNKGNMKIFDIDKLKVSLNINQVVDIIIKDPTVFVYNMDDDDEEETKPNIQVEDVKNEDEEEEEEEEEYDEDDEFEKMALNL